MPPSKRPASQPAPAAPPTDAPLVPVGYITKAHGIRGEVILVLQAESPDILAQGIFVRPRHGGATRPMRVVGMRRHHGNLLLSLEGVVTRNDAELLRSHTVLVSERMLPPLEEDEIYLRDLPGLKVFVSEDGRECELGVIREVSAPAGQDLWTIATENGREILFPAVDEFILSIEPENGKALIAPPPGLLDLYLGDPNGG